uniref:XK-related protein n=1 Tax=Timema monikensis TaxID=170555 RepID=A0A7R9ELM3_9NEOP|nr:unnamed protein product [Timema monikensis]
MKASLSGGLRPTRYSKKTGGVFVPGVSAAASLVSLAWAVASYTRAMRRTRADKSKVSWPGLLLQALWRGGMLAARVASLVLFAVGFKAWIFLLLGGFTSMLTWSKALILKLWFANGTTGVHWMGMTTWVVLQRTDLCETPAEERVYNCVVGIIYCFCFFNLQEGPTRKRALAFYIIVIGQNVSCLCLFGTLGGASRPGLFRMSAATIIGGTLLGISSMLLYYRFFHPSGPIRLCSKDLECDVEKTHKTHLHPDLNATLRSLKHPRHSEKDSLSKLDVTPPRQSEDIYTDKKLLLTHCVSSPSLPCVTTQSEEDKLSGQEDFDTLKHRRRGICSTEDLVVDLPLDKQQVEDILEVKETFTEAVKQKRRGICPLEPDTIVELQLSRNAEEKENSSNEDLMKQKRRGIYSSEDLVSEVGRAQSIESKEESLSVLCEKVDSEILRRKRRGICSSDCLDSEQVKELVVDKQIESQLGETEDAPSEVLSVPSEVLSAHDYENMCAVNIAREAWGLRSWRGYSDIETWLHDDSVVRDSRRDTLTSTVTSASSENSGSSPPPVPSRRPKPLRSRQDDYLDTLIYDLADCESEQSISVFVVDPPPPTEPDPGVFMARPYVVDQTGAMFPLSTLDTIVEELEDSSTSLESLERPHRQRHGSASTLVATIDEIRHGNLFNSPDKLWRQVSCHSEMTPSSLLMPNHSQPHLSPEEVLFLSRLKPSSPDTSPSPKSGNTPQNRSLADSNPPNKSSVEVVPSVRDPSFCVPNSENVLHRPSENIPKQNTKPNRPRRKFSLIREKFEQKKCENKTEIETQDPLCHIFTSPLHSPLTAVYSEPLPDDVTTNILLENEPIVFYNKENVPGRIKQWNAFLKSQNTCNVNWSPETCKVIAFSSGQEQESCKVKPALSNLKERRSIFLKQVLSPPKFQNWSKKGSLSPTSKVVPAL